MNPKISIIVPVYNAEKYLYDCLTSIREQTYKDFEVVLVDDESIDNSLKILKQFSSEDARFQLYQQTHRGVSAARNVGLKNAVGEYICFVDADDQIAPSFIEDLYLAMGDADSSMCGFRKIDLLSHEDCEVVPDQKVKSIEENLIGFYDANSKDWQRYLWNRMFKHPIIQTNGLRFREDLYYKEDGLFLVQYLFASNGRVGCVDKILYYYYRNTNGAMSKTWHTFDEKIITNLEAHRLIIQEIKGHNVSDVVLSKAVSQAKAACNWILQMMSQVRSHKLLLLIRIERIMVSMLGMREYLCWRTSQLCRLFK